MRQAKGARIAQRPLILNNRQQSPAFAQILIIIQVYRYKYNYHLMFLNIISQIMHLFSNADFMLLVNPNLLYFTLLYLQFSFIFQSLIYFIQYNFILLIKLIFDFEVQQNGILAHYQICCCENYNTKSLFRRKKQNMKTYQFVILIAIAVVVSPICLNTAELDGECTACSPLDLLLQGNCYPKMRGCLNYTLPGPKCVKCQSGYLLDGADRCQRQAVFDLTKQLDLNAVDIPPVVIDNPDTLNYRQIIEEVGKQNAPYVTDAIQIFLTKYPQLGLGNTKSVSKLQTKTGIFFTINYQSSINGLKYEGVAIKNKTSNISPLYFKQADAQPRDPKTVDNLIRQILGTKLTDFFIYQIRFVNEIYSIYYMNSAYSILMVQFYRADIGQLLSSRMTVRSLGVADLAKQYMLNRFPELKTRVIISVRRYQDFYAFNFDPDVTVSVRFRNFQFEPNKPIQVSIYAPEFDYYQDYPLFMGSYLDFSPNDPKYLKCKQVAFSEIPELQATIFSFGKVARDLSQPPSAPQSYFYAFSMERPLYGDFYDVYTVYSPQNTCKLSYVLKNGYSLLFSQRYNYNTDSSFFKSYNNASLASKVQTIPAIESVIMKSNGPSTSYYKVNYSPSQFMEFRFNKSSGVTTLISYTVEGENILVLMGIIGQTPLKAAPDLYLNYLENKQNITVDGDIAAFSKSTMQTVLNYVTNAGTYQAKIDSNSNNFPIKSFSQVSNWNCFDFTNVNKNKATKIDSFLRNNYNLGDFTLQIIQSRVNKVGNTYRVLYSNSRLKQIQFTVQELFTLFNVIYTRMYNDGLDYVEASPYDIDYQLLTQYLSTINLQGNRLPLMTESNSKVIRGYYNDGKVTYRIYMDKTAGTVKTQAYQGITTWAPSTCQTTDTIGRCLSCDSSKTLYQGICWPKIEGCRVQVGTECLRCNNPYILSQKLCKKNCNELILIY